MKLFEFLENNGLAHFVGSLDLESLGQVWADTEYETCTFLEDESKGLIHKYTKKKIYVTEELRELVRNKYKSKEQLKGEKELFLTRVALVITFLGLVASIFVPLLSTSKIEIEKSIKANNIRIELKNISKELEVISNKINMIGNSSIKMREGITKPLSEIISAINCLNKNKDNDDKKK